MAFGIDLNIVWNILGIGGTLLIILIILGIIAFLLWFWWFISQHKDRVLIFDVFGMENIENIKVKTEVKEGQKIINDVELRNVNLKFRREDKGRFLLRNGRNEGYRLLWSFMFNKKAIIPFNSRFFIPTNKGRMLFMIKYNNEYIPYLPNAPNIIPFTSEALKFWHIEMTKYLSKKYEWKDFWDKYGTYIMFTLCMIICVVLIIITMNKVSEVMKMSLQAQAQCKQAVVDMAKQQIQPVG